MEDLVKKYLQDKYGENYDQKAREDFDSAKDSNRWAQLGSNIGDAIAGNKIGSANGYFQDLNKQAKENTIGKIETDRNQFVDNQLKSGQMAEIQRKQLENDPNSEESKRYREIVKGVTPKYAEMMGDNFETLTSGNSDKLFQLIKNKEDNDRAREQARILMGQRDQVRQDKMEAKAEKEKDLSAAESKQLGLYKSGLLAENQFANAVSDKDAYDPTSSGQWIDNSQWAPNWMKNDKAIEAQNAQSAWVESYLRDASGAAIPPNERHAYAVDFFPQPGDTDQMVKNKQMLRAQKMDNARIAAGRKAQNIDPELAQTAESMMSVSGGSIAAPQKNKQSDEAAMKWAMENPKDPRASAILKKARPTMKAGF